MLQPTLARTALNHCCRWRCLCSHAAVRGAKPGKNVQLQENEIRGLCLKSREIFLSQPILLELEAPLKICGKWDLYAYVKKNYQKWNIQVYLLKKNKKWGHLIFSFYLDDYGSWKWKKKIQCCKILRLCIRPIKKGFIILQTIWKVIFIYALSIWLHQSLVLNQHLHTAWRRWLPFPAGLGTYPTVLDWPANSPDMNPRRESMGYYQK